MVILIIYIIGCFIALGLLTYQACIWYYDDMEDITVGIITLMILCALCSWYAVVGYGVYYIISIWDKIVIKNNKIE